MDSIRRMVLVACLLAIAMTILDMLYPSKKFDKQVKLIFSLVFTLGVLTPFLSGKITLSLPEIGKPQSSPSYSGIETTVAQEYKNAIETNISKTLSECLKENQISAEEIFTKVNIAEDNSISISEVEVMSHSEADSAEIIRLIKSRLGQETNVVVKQEE